MQNSYIIAGIIVLVAILGFVFAGKRTEAPVEENSQNMQAESGPLTDGSYKIDTSASSITWTGEFIVGPKETGTIKLSSGEASVVNGLITSGNFVIDMNTVVDSAGKQRLTDHLKGDDFFSVSTHPTATFELRSFAPSGDDGEARGRYIVGGNLTIKGITIPISFMANITVTENGDKVGISTNASFAINRADWEIKYNSPSFFQNLGDKAIRDAVEIVLDLKAVKE